MVVVADFELSVSRKLSIITTLSKADVTHHHHYTVCAHVYVCLCVCGIYIRTYMLHMYILCTYICTYIHIRTYIQSNINVIKYFVTPVKNKSCMC